MTASGLSPSAPTLAILAGGEGRRMGRPKADIRIGGSPILEYLLGRFAWEGPTILVTAPGRERPIGSERFDGEVVDPVAGQGPLRGVLTALEHCQTPTLVVCTVDMPLIGREQVGAVVDHLERGEAPTWGVMVARLGADAHAPIVEPFPCALRVADALPHVQSCLSGPRGSMRALARVPGFNLLCAPTAWPPSAWTNLNDPTQLADFTRSVE